ncbi:MAG: hypothetical protein ACJ77K_02430 [Bacteroidia bacterium]
MKFKYCFFSVFTLTGLALAAQPSQDNQAGVTLIGDSPDNNAGNNDAHDFIQSNPYAEQNAPQTQQMTQGNIEPTLENGFHMRYELNSPKADEPLLVAGINTSQKSAPHSTAGGASSVGKAKRRTPSMTERSFNVKKRLNTWLPKRKKRYHPHLCGRF